MVDGIILDNDRPIINEECVPICPDWSYGLILKCLKCPSCGYSVATQYLKRNR